MTEVRVLCIPLKINDRGGFKQEGISKISNEIKPMSMSTRSVQHAKDPKP